MESLFLTPEQTLQMEHWIQSKILFLNVWQVRWENLSGQEDEV